ncbi:MAG: hypothetical protein LW815_02155 [Chitinophagaceae bacterium]|nr:hypothetical protein [Chitinophagaceae bacterium]
MSSLLLFSFVLGYFTLLLGVAMYTARNATNESFFIGNRNSNWMLVAFGMIGTTSALEKKVIKRAPCSSSFQEPLVLQPGCFS